MKLIWAKYNKVLIIIVNIVITAFTLSHFAKLIQHLLSIHYSWQFEFFMVIGMLFFQYPFIFKKNGQLKLAYYYNMLLVSLIGSILLWPLIILNHYYHFGDEINLTYFFAVVVIMFFNHKQRVAKLNLPIHISYTWVLYRVIILMFII